MALAKFRITGICPLLMHNERMANPVDPIALELKKVTSKKTKTPEDYAEISEIEWHGSLYHNDALGPFIPGRWMDACIKNGATMRKLGKAVLQSVTTIQDEVPLEYDGPRDKAKMFKASRFIDIRSVVISRRRTMRTRPMFPEWSCQFDIDYNENILSHEQLVDSLIAAGESIGLGDYRPRFGKFTVEELE